MIREKCREHALKHLPDELEELERRPELSEAHPELSLYENEKEVLFLPGTHFKVLGVTKERSYTLIRLEEVNE